MRLNQAVLEKVAEANKQLVAVTKYFSASELAVFQADLLRESCVLALGENRIEVIKQKQIPRQFCHFIGNIQSRNIADIAVHCSVVHSLCKVSHLKKFLQQPVCPQFFLQINVSGEPQKGGLLPEELPLFLAEITDTSLILGLSAIGAYSADALQKQKEFAVLNQLRRDHNPAWKLSAGTSVDYEQALENGVDIVRIGRKLFGNVV
ncbi:hypothetical protein CSB37_02395 [bacterium DOLZORAL124_38_8]|nr:MAG: hypothetical protein CSB37_02395 [bacterium DOLZORAL124_38_8]